MSAQTGPASPAIAPPPVPADVGIVAALSIEISPFLARLTNVRKYATARDTIIEGELAGKLVAAVITGPGRKNASRGAQLLIGGHRPNWLISAGFGGALDLNLRRNDVVFASEVVDEDGVSLLIDVAVPDDPANARVSLGKLITVDRILRTAVEKAALRDRTGAAVVDMETAAVAALCGDRNVKFLAIRVISDEAGVDLPREIATILGRTGGYRIGAALGAIWRRPSSLKDMWALREHAVAAAERLSGVLLAILAKLP